MQFLLSSKLLFQRWSRRNRFIFLVLAVICGLIWLGGWHTPGLKALDTSDSTFKPVSVSTNWQYGSFPVENFQAYTSPFGYRTSPTNNQIQEFHRGLDLAAPVGSYVRSWWSGQIVELSDDTSCGTMIKIQSGKWQHIYCHLDGHVETTGNSPVLIDRAGSIQLLQGQQIPAGARIARVGMTGRTTGPHLHWGLKYGDSYVDPALVLREMYRQNAVMPSPPSTAS